MPAGGAEVGVTLVPHGAVGDRDVIVSPDPDADLNVMVTHGTVPGLTVQGHELGEVDLPNHVLEDRFDYVALGHYHYFHRHRENTYYAGATERFSFAEAGAEPGFLVLDFSDGGFTVEHVPLQSRPMIDLPRIDASDMSGPDLSEAVRERTEATDQDLDGAIVRLKVRDASRGLAGAVDRALLRDLKRRCLDFSLEISETGAEAASGVEAAASFSSLEEEFKAFVGDRRERGGARAGVRRGLSWRKGSGI